MSSEKTTNAAPVDGIVMRLATKDAVRYMAEYMQTYPNQKGYEQYEMATYVNDVLYGIGVSMNPDDYQYADGFSRFKKALREFLDA